MGRTIQTATQILQQEQAGFRNFRRALRRSDQVAFDDLFSNAKKHTASITMAAHSLPFEAILLAMLLEEHKEVMRLRRLVEGELNFGNHE